MNVVSCAWLHSQLGGEKPDNLVVLDASWLIDADYVANYRDCHIPSAQYFDINKDTTPTQYVTIPIPGKEDFQKQARSLGIHTDSHVVVYEKTMYKYPMPSVRAWWLFKYYGHDKVSLLNGGLWEWQKLGYPVEKGDQTAQKSGNFIANEHPNLLKTFENMQSIAKNDASNITIVDVREPDYYKGEVDEPNIYIKSTLEFRGFEPDKCKLHKGHMPGAVSVHFRQLLDSELTKLQPKEVCEKVFEKTGIDKSKPVVFTCHLGLTACTVALVADQLGFKDWSVYIGSWIEWSQKAQAEMCVTEKTKSTK